MAAGRATGLATGFRRAAEGRGVRAAGFPRRRSRRRLSYEARAARPVGSGGASGLHPSRSG
eukprot:10418125-Lingulodinium_polyedra.AAC.1